MRIPPPKRGSKHIRNRFDLGLCVLDDLDDAARVEDELINPLAENPPKSERLGLRVVNDFKGLTNGETSDVVRFRNNISSSLGTHDGTEDIKSRERGHGRPVKRLVLEVHARGQG